MASLKTIGGLTIGIIILLVGFWLVGMLPSIYPTWSQSQLDMARLILMLVSVAAPFIGMMQE